MSDREPNPTTAPKPMTEVEIKAAVTREINSAVGFTADALVAEQTDALKRYFGQPYGDEMVGRSSMVDRTVMDTIEQAMPSIMRIFSTREALVRFEPVMPAPDMFQDPKAYEQEAKKRSQQADQATAYLNWIFWEDNGGFVLLHDWIKDALIQKVGTLKMDWESTREVRFQTFTNLTPMQITKIVTQDLPGAEIVEQEQTSAGQVTPLPQGGVMPAVPTFNVKLKLTRKIGKVSIIGVPPEEFMISRMARSATDMRTVFTCHHTLKSRSELIEEGFDPAQVQGLAAGMYKLSQQDNTARARFADESSLAFTNRTGQNTLIETFNCDMRLDADGDGIAELRNIVYAGQEILLNKEVPRVPFYTLCPIRVPHKFFGLSYADMTSDLQRLKTTLWRQMLDNLYRTNTPSLRIGPGVNIDDILNQVVGGAIRCDDVSQVAPISIPFTAGESFPMLSYVDEQRRQRTGVSADVGALSPEALKRVTAEGISEMMTMAKSRPELVARIFAETGIKQLFTDMLELVRENQDYARMIKIRGNDVAMDPREWTADMTCVCRVGMGYASEEDETAALQEVLAMQEKIVGTPGGGNGSVTPQNIFNTITRYFPLRGLPDTSPFFNMPGPPPPAVDPPEVQKAKLEIESTEKIEMARIASHERVKTAEYQSLARIKAAEALMNDERARQENAAKTALDMARLHKDTAFEGREIEIREQEVKNNERRDAV